MLVFFFFFLLWTHSLDFMALRLCNIMSVFFHAAGLNFLIQFNIRRFWLGNLTFTFHNDTSASELTHISLALTSMGMYFELSVTIGNDKKMANMKDIHQNTTVMGYFQHFHLAWRRHVCFLMHKTFFLRQRSARFLPSANFCPHLIRSCLSHPPWYCKILLRDLCPGSPGYFYWDLLHM